MNAFRCGTVALVGRPNTGKSSLLNRLLGQKVAIVSSKPQTTRHLVRGILSTPDCQIVFTDSPGYQTRHVNPLNRVLNRRASEAAQDTDAVLFVIEATRYGGADQAVLARLPRAARIVAAVNKVDLVKADSVLLQLVAKLDREQRFAAIVPVSAQTGKNIPELMRVLCGLVPEQAAIYPPDQLSDQDERFFAAEILREKLFRMLGEELPYRCEVVIDGFKEQGRLRRIDASIWVERESQKPILVGKGGEKLKRISTAARLDMEKLFGGKVYLGTWVKVKDDWSGDSRLLRQLGYG
ncbi:MAG: GTPase Era [Betaproteobacteria bacterium]|nr:GTPase Era [Betaproteobacteria bacterium]